MPRRWTTSLSTDPRRAVAYAAVWGALSLVPYLPALVSPLPLSPYFPLSVEVLALATAVTYAAGTTWAYKARLGAAVGIGGLLLYETYDALVYTAFGRSGILYEDLRFADNLGYLAMNLMSWEMAAVSLGVLGGLGAGGLLVWWGLGVLARSGRSGASRTLLLAAHLVAWPLVGVVGPALEAGPVNLTYQTSNERTRVRTTMGSAAANLRASLRLRDLLDSLSTAPVDTTYAAYNSVSLTRTPPIYLFAVESYGSVLARHPDLRGPYRDLLHRTETALGTDGWSAASARSVVPVRGGRSWLSIASLLTGVRVEHQLLYNQFLVQPRDSSRAVPHLVDFLDGHGYQTVALQPFTFERPGLPVGNPYDFDRTVYRNDLQYSGPSYGLADAPDQYSLHYTHANFLAPQHRPFFLFFETVDSHSLWNYGLPPYLDDWRHFNTPEGAEPSVSTDTRREPPVFLPDSLTSPRIYDQPTPIRYLRHVAHELRVVREYVTEKAPEGSLVLLLGDHQPPLLNAQDSTVPIHVLSTDSTLTRLATKAGFSRGLHPGASGKTFRHEGLYSTLVRLLVRYDRTSRQDVPHSLPPLRPSGVSPSLLVQ